jgi:hypothetical protein
VVQWRCGAWDGAGADAARRHLGEARPYLVDVVVAVDGMLADMRITRR